tara:strand:- start:161 stop:331 length:171 start_codon:yes stop_codon:yes gene_type:complete
MKQVFPKIKKSKPKDQRGTSSFEKRMETINKITNNGKCWWVHQYLMPYVRTGGCKQ